MSNTPQHPLDFLPKFAADRAKAIAAESARPQRRLLLIGVSGSGKTFSCCTTCPNPVPVDYENQLDHTEVRSKLAGVFPMWDKKWIEENIKGVPNRAEDHLNWVIDNHLAKLSNDYTAIFDTMSSISDRIYESFEVQFNRRDKDGSFRFWDAWGTFWNRFTRKLETLTCNVVMIAHETQFRDAETGRIISYGWMLPGQVFTPRIPTRFTDVVRQVREQSEPDQQGRITTKYKWQIGYTKEFDVAKSRCSAGTLYIPADWRVLTK